MGLEDKQCIACRGDVEPLSIKEATVFLPQVPGWEIVEKGAKITRRFTFNNWKKAMELVRRIDVIAEAEKHHPDVSFGWGYCAVTVQTHAIGGLHENDFILAAKINRAAEGI
ncbi:MAG: 4a-hydroxytetrahydrobiopterin dehydratase [Proteobacteria bacterium]|nr:4a-hydroxytetrahydrobiopterin dehydratase [Pseudomonadota bacterium]